MENHSPESEFTKKKKMFLFLIIFFVAVFASYRIAYRLRSFENTARFYDELNKELDEQESY